MELCLIKFYYFSSFGHLDGINTTIRAGNQNYPFADAHIRFEKSTDMRAKASNSLEEVKLNKIRHLSYYSNYMFPVISEFF
jgi:hypothetical protein